MPAVSVLMSVFNGERWLSESIQSVLAQTYADFEFIIVNDGSTDGSLEIVNWFANQDSRIRVFNKSNTGLSDSLNYGIGHARGEWIARIDADDLCHPQRIEKQYALVRSDSELILAGSGLTLIDEVGSHGHSYCLSNKHRRLVRHLASGGLVFAHSSAFFNRSMVMQIGGYNCILGRSEDRDLWLRLSERGKISCIREPLVFVRKHEQQLSHSLDGLQQLIDSYIAMTVYWIRRLGFPDPLDGASPEEVNRFRGWLEKRMQDEGLLASLGLFATLKKSWLSNSTFARKSLSLASLCYYRPRLVLCYLQVRSGRSRLPVCFAYDWIKAQP